MPTYRALLAGLALAVLGGCMDLQPVATRSASNQIAVTDARVVVAGPPGFCVDTKASRATRDAAFLILGSCAAIANEPLLPQPDLPVVLTAAVARGAPISPAALGAYFRSSRGAAAHASGERLIRTLAEDDAVFLYSAGPHGENWRGIIPLESGMIVTVALRPSRGARLPQSAQFATLDAFAARIAAANRRGQLAQGSR